MTAVDQLAAASRIRQDIEAFAAFSEPGDGVTRLAFTDLERQAHGYFHERMAELGLRVHTDAAGNTLAELSPSVRSAESLPALGTGSHLDSVLHGGRFDGIAGVAAAMEVARQAVEEGGQRRRPWRFVAFAGEEGARFGQACNGSRMAVGLTQAHDLEHLHDADGITLARAMQGVGLRTNELETAVWRPEDWRSFIELHIEQGTVLERDDVAVGIVDCISGSSRLSVQVTGVASHSGGTPMVGRRDALVTAARCVLECRRMALGVDHEGTRVTVGRFEVRPGSLTTIPGEVRFTVDVRDIEAERQHETAQALSERFTNLAAADGVDIAIERIGDTDPVLLNPQIHETLVTAARMRGVTSQPLNSGASHDSQQIGHILPTGMIFVPSRNGLSHVPEEHTDFSQIAVGADVLGQALRLLDAA